MGKREMKKLNATQEEVCEDFLLHVEKPPKEKITIFVRAFISPRHKIAVVINH
jgi:hypothetical protein